MAHLRPFDAEQSSAWSRLHEHATRVRTASLSTHACEVVPTWLRVGELGVDLSRHWADDAVWRDLFDLASEAGLRERARAMADGAVINRSEGRAVLHMALRADAGEILVAGEDLGATCADARRRMYAFIDAAHAGRAVGATGRRFEALIHVGIGGSELGPRFVDRALAGAAAQPGARQLRFLASTDIDALARATAGLDPETTLISVASKSFSTAETLRNAADLRDWIHGSSGERSADWSRHFVAATANTDAAAAWGLERDQVFDVWPWVGGRFSLWSTVGFPVAWRHGPSSFDELLAGARDMDRHFLSAPWSENLPARVGLIGAWYGGCFDAPTRCVVPYATRLDHLVSYMQQLYMESNGKRVNGEGQPLAGPSAPVLWGDVGPQAQHAFFQLLQQGQHFVPVDLVAVAKATLSSEPAHAARHASLLASCLGQAQALMHGDPQAEPSHRAIPGGQPSTLWLLDRLSPRALGNLLACFEHEVFVQSALWGINAFDQWGVEAGKKRSAALEPALRDAMGLEGSTATRDDPSLTAVFAHLRELHRGEP